jgi:FkbM family methyltransferase
MPNGKDSLIFFDLFFGKLYELEGYSFSINKNSLLLVKNNKTIDDKILICACTKYMESQENGLLFVNTKINDSKELYDSFIKTGNFQPYCLAQIYLVDTSIIKDNDQNEKERKKYSTDYFFVGGFDQERAKGAIKLYKIYFDYNPAKITIKFVHDIILENEKEEFYGFNGAVTSIVQSYETGEFLISCSDGNICLFTQANINYFLYYDELEKNELDYEDIALFFIFYDVENGFYIDVGANDPNILSVTKAFYLRGWNGINIEPLPDKHKLLLNERKRDINLQIGVGKEKTISTLYMRGPGSTFSEIYKKENLTSLNVTIDTMSSVCEKYVPKGKIIQFCKIDVEGGERDVLLGYDFKKYRPKVFCIESTKPSTMISTHNEWENILLANNYSFAYRSVINRFYIDNNIEGLSQKFNKVNKLMKLYRFLNK